MNAEATNDHSRGDHRGPRGRGGPEGRGRGPRRRRRGSGVNRGDVRTAVLTLLSEEPMHGYQIMQELIERSRGAWRPSPGSVYPTLQQLADEGLVRSDDRDGRKVFELTGVGAEAATDAAGSSPPWERIAEHGGSTDLRHAIAALAGAAKQVAISGTREQVEKAEEILTDARKRLYGLLAE